MLTLDPPQHPILCLPAAVRPLPPRRQSPTCPPESAAQSVGPDARPGVDHKNATTVPLADETALPVGVDPSDATAFSRARRNAHSDAETLARSEYAASLGQASLSPRSAAASAADPTRLWTRAIRHPFFSDGSDDPGPSKNLTRHHYRERSPATVYHAFTKVLLPTIFRILHLQTVRLSTITPSGRTLLLETVAPRRGRRHAATERRERTRTEAVVGRE